MPVPLPVRERIKIVLLFTAAGPVFGSLPFVIPLALIGLHSGFSDPSGNLPILMVLIVSYLIGLIPAIICGGIYQWIAARLSGITPQRTKIQTLVVGLLSGLVTGFVTVCVLFFMHRDNVIFYAAILFSSMLAGALCALIARRWTDKPAESGR